MLFLVKGLFSNKAFWLVNLSIELHKCKECIVVKPQIDVIVIFTKLFRKFEKSCFPKKKEKDYKKGIEFSLFSVYSVQIIPFHLTNEFTILQKLEKCEFKAQSVEIQEFNCHPILREIISGRI